MFRIRPAAGYATKFPAGTVTEFTRTVIGFVSKWERRIHGPPLAPTVYRSVADCRPRRVICPWYVPIGVPAGTAMVAVKVDAPFAGTVTCGAERESQFQSVFWKNSIRARIGRPPRPVPKRRTPKTSPSWLRIGPLWTAAANTFASGWLIVIRFRSVNPVVSGIGVDQSVSVQSYTSTMYR